MRADICRNDLRKSDQHLNPKYLLYIPRLTGLEVKSGAESQGGTVRPGHGGRGIGR
jgi:hypothetical protein